MKLVFIIFIFFSYNHSKDSNFFYFSEDGMKFKKTFWDLANFTNQTKKYLQHLQFFLQHKFVKTIQNTKPDK